MPFDITFIQKLIIKYLEDHPEVVKQLAERLVDDLVDLILKKLHDSVTP